MQLGVLARSVLFSGLILLLAIAIPHAATWTVDADGSGDAASIQSAIDQAASGDTIRVGPGEYPVHLWIEAKGVVLQSAQGPAVTILRGVVAPDKPVIDNFYDGGSTSIIEGFTIRDGTTGIRCTSASPIIRGNVITQNRSALGAGVCCNFSSNAVIEENLIVRNRTWFHCCFPSRGGGIYADDTSAAVIRKNVIAYNRCDGQCLGGGVSAFLATIEGNTIFGNHADGPGGGLELPGDGAVVSNNIICGNESAEFGDGVVAFHQATLFCNDVFANGTEDYWGVDPGQGDLRTDPRFCGIPSVQAEAGTVRAHAFDLRSDSPCLEEQNPNGAACGQIGARPQGCGTAIPAIPKGPGSTILPYADAFPNPATPSTTLRLELPTAGRPVIQIVDASGRRVRSLETGLTSAGIHNLLWDGRDDEGRPLPNGIYFIRVRLDHQETTCRLVMLH